MRWYLIVYQEMLSAFALIFMTTFRLYFSITMFGATRNLNYSKVANFELNENRFLAENPILMQSKVKLRIKKTGLFM